MASPPLAAGSGGEGSSGSAGPDPSDRQLSTLFEQAAERLPALLPSASKEQLLYLYARYKQVKFGTCNTPKPSFFDFEGKQKWEAWKALGDTSPHQAMQEYVDTVKKLDPNWNPQTTEKRGKESKTAFGGPVVSSLYQEETIREEDKNIFDYCRENNIDYVTKAIQSKKVDVNVADEEGRALLHWACDRGHKELVSALLQHAADINSQHYTGECSKVSELKGQQRNAPGWELPWFSCSSTSGSFWPASWKLPALTTQRS
ncbi:acyl-CoA-binding domain-containing protein 6 isoform X2 [Centrocercus urophasianus]|uniref:acyl-CoA-binding domain-containing protein 6 isoform X2 n=1 Tax=Centrocercus urophasianus TaxID=9002 RepID=UPI001C64FCB2|nr:acyl-CoA-binding domain-containing protein 6 isoform X2 [Centrocercus urophasianus]